MKQSKLIMTMTCEMCDKTKRMVKWSKLPDGWKLIAGKHYCAHCKRLVGRKVSNLSTLEIRRCLMTHPLYRRVK